MPHVRARGVVALEGAGVGAGFDCHVGDRHALVHRQRAEAGTTEFQRRVGGAIDADPVNQRQDHVLSGHVRPGAAAQRHTDTFWDPHPELAGGQGGGEIGRAEADTQRIERAGGAGMAVGPEHDAAMTDQAELVEQGVLDAAASRLVEMPQGMGAGEAAQHVDRARAVDILGRGEMVGDQHDIVRVGRAVCAHDVELLEGHRTGYVVQHQHVRGDGDDVAGAGPAAFGMRCQDLLGDG